MDLLRSLPIGLYLEEPTTWLHHLDPRIKLVWLMGFLLSPILANSSWRIALVAVLIAMTLTVGIPLRVWRQQMGWLLILGTLVMVLTAIAPDGLPAEHQPRRPSQALTEVPALSIAPAPNQNPWYNPLGWGQPSPDRPPAEPPLPPPLTTATSSLNKAPSPSPAVPSISAFASPPSSSPSFTAPTSISSPPPPKKLPLVSKISSPPCAGVTSPSPKSP